MTKKSKEFDFFNFLNLYHNSKFNLYIKESQLYQAGYGVYTHDLIPANTFIDYYEGVVMSSSMGGNYFFQINDEYGIDGFGPPRCYMAMLNDANFNFSKIDKMNKKKKRKNIIIDRTNELINNCRFEVDENNLKVSIFSIEKIEAESELFISYGLNYWDNN